MAKGLKRESGWREVESGGGDGGDRHRRGRLILLVIMGCLKSILIQKIINLIKILKDYIIA